MESRGKENDRQHALVGVGSDVKPVRNEHPLTTFKGLLSDFAGGIRSLHALADRRPGSTTTPAVSARTAGLQLSAVRAGLEKSTNAETTRTESRVRSESIQRRSVTEKQVESRLRSEALPGRSVLRKESSPVAEKVMTFSDAKTKGVNSTVAMAREVSKLVSSISQNNTRTVGSLGIQSAMMPSASRHRSMRPVFGADKEAFRQINESGRSNSLHHVPSPARLAQIMHADSLVRRGHGRASPELHALAEGVRNGQRREVADLDPERVQEILNQAMGGATRAAQMLNTPLVNQLIERHTATVKSLQNRISSKEREILRQGGKDISPRARESAMPSLTVPKSISRFNTDSSQISNSVSSIASNLTGSDTPPYASELMNMAETNDTPHLNAAAAASENDVSNSINAYRNRDRVLSSGSSSGGGDTSLASLTDGPRPTAGGYSSVSKPAYDKVSKAAQSQGRTDRPIPFDSIPTSGKASSAMKDAMAASGGKSKKSVEITGKLKLYGENGQSLGAAMMEGSM